MCASSPVSLDRPQKVAVYGDRLRLARQLHRLTQTKFADLVGVSQSAISQYESNAAAPGADVLARVVEITGFPATFFEREPAPDVPLGSLAFRARKYASTRLDQEQAHAWTSLLHECVQAFASQVTTHRIVIPDLRGEDVTSATQITRSALGLSPDGPVPNLTYTLERAGVFVLALPVSLPGRDAFSAWIGDSPRRPIIMVTPDAPGDRERFSLAHELKHLTMDSSVRGRINDVEAAADQFASEFLMPEAGIRDDLVPPITIQRVAELKPRWGVSMQALVRRAADLDLISERRKQQLQRSIAIKWGKHEPVQIEREKPRMLRKMAEVVIGNPPAAQRLAAALDWGAPFAATVLAAHAESSELRGLAVERSNENVVRFKPRSS